MSLRRAGFVLIMLLAVHSLSQAQPPGWVKDAVFYQIFPERFANGDPANDPPGTESWGGTPTTKNYFGGDIQGIIDHLGYITSLGVNALYINPIFESNTNHKYQTKDYLRIDPHFGTEHTFKTLIDSCHARGIRVVIDGVFNHTGVDFFAFADIRKNGARSKYVKWYNIHSFPLGPVRKPNYEAWWGYGSLPKLMTQNPEVREYLFGVTRHWMNLGIDGWRLDVPNEIPHEFWIEWRKLVKSINPEAYIVGEIWENGAPWLKGDQFDAVMNYRFRDACVDFFAKGKTTAHGLDTALARQRAEYPPEVNYALQNLLGSHDTERFLTMCKGDTRAWKLAVLLQMTYPGAPMIYYGDEVGMEGGKDPGCRGTMIWDDQRQNRDMLSFLRGVTALRSKHEVFRRGTFASLTSRDTSGIFTFVRKQGEKTACVVLNRSQAEEPVELPSLQPPDRWVRIWPSDAGEDQHAGVKTTIPPVSGAVFISGGMH